MSHVKLVDTTLRDGQQSLWACHMRLDAMVPALEDIDEAGYEGIEIFVASAQFSRGVRDLHENPWEWLHAATSRVKKTPLRLHGAMHSAFASIPKCVQSLFLERIADLGIQLTRASDPWNSPAGLESTVASMRAHGIETIANIIYSVSPRHTLDYYAERTKAIAALGPTRLCFKDVGGLMTPAVAQQLLPIVLENSNGIPVEFHAHCTNGLAGFVALEAADLGIGIIHTSIPPLAEGASQPSVFNIASNLRARGHTVDLDLGRLGRVSDHFNRVAEYEDLPKGTAQVYDESLYLHQVPGGMISNLKFQLHKLGMSDRWPDALHEMVQVRADLGYPIMVTPLSQFVGSQAVLNVISGTRYGTVTDEVIEYALGRWGAEAPSAMDPEIKALILNRGRAEQIENRVEIQPSLKEVRARLGETLSDEELILRVFSGIGSEPLPWTTSPRPPESYAEYVTMRSPLLSVIKRIGSSPGIRSFHVDLGGEGGIAVGRRR